MALSYGSPVFRQVKILNRMLMSCIFNIPGSLN
jgi:hypothetical protein